MEIITCLAVNNNCYKSAKLMTPEGVLVHSTGANNPYLKRYVDCPEEFGINKYGNHWNVPKPGGKSKCVHGFIGLDKNKIIRVAQILPYNYCSWGCGSGKNGSYNYNPSYIQFEICEDDLTDEKYFNDVFNVAAEYCYMLSKQFHFPIENIRSHYEAAKEGMASNHGDPDHWLKKFGKDMNDFRDMVRDIQVKNDKVTVAIKERIEQSKEQIVTPPSCDDEVKPVPSQTVPIKKVVKKERTKDDVKRLNKTKDKM
jgi:hypothetical protein